MLLQYPFALLPVLQQAQPRPLSLATTFTINNLTPPILKPSTMEPSLNPKFYPLQPMKRRTANAMTEEQ